MNERIGGAVFYSFAYRFLRYNRLRNILSGSFDGLQSLCYLSVSCDHRLDVRIIFQNVTTKVGII